MNILILEAPKIC